MRKSDRIQARSQGELAAARELRRLSVPLTQAVDIFGIIERQQIWLLFKPVDGALGVYLPNGILINTKRRLGIQRLTAAHEYGHHVLKHEVSVDGEENLGSPETIKEFNEVEAQAFATDFLMPVQLVNALWNIFNFDKNITPAQAYLLSLYLGTSYQATVYQLLAQERITPFTGQKFLKVQPKAIKQQIGRGIGPQNPWAEMWPIDATQSGTSIEISIDDEISIQLPESPSTGYLWSVEPEGVQDQITSKIEAGEAILSDAPLSLVRTDYEMVDRSLLSSGTGGEGSRYIALRAMQPGKVRLRITLTRPWLSNEVPLETFLLNVHIAEKATNLLQNLQEALSVA